MGRFHPHLSFFRMQLIKGLQYRTAAWAGIFTQFFWGFMQIQLYRALYAAHQSTFPMAFSGLVSYIWLRQAFLALLNTWSYEYELFDMILSGNVALELCRPVGLYGMWFARNAALRVSRAALRCGPILIISALLPAPWGLNPPASWGAFAAFLLSLILTLGVTCAMTLIVYFSCFYTLSSQGLRTVLDPVTEFLNGAIVPLPFMPAWLSSVLRYTPFGAMVNAPLRIYSGDIRGMELTEALLLQVFWLAALMGLGWLIQHRGLKRLCLQGG